MRFIHKIGFNSFPEFKAYLKNNHQSLHNVKVHYVTEDNFPSDTLSKLNIVADKIYQADNIITIGMGDSAFLAEYAARKDGSSRIKHLSCHGSVLSARFQIGKYYQ